jgi:hypothetical protein
MRLKNKQLSRKIQEISNKLSGVKEKDSNSHASNN